MKIFLSVFTEYMVDGEYKIEQVKYLSSYSFPNSQERRILIVDL